LIKDTQPVKPIKQSPVRELPFVPQFLGAKMTGEAMWVNNLNKVACYPVEH